MTRPLLSIPIGYAPAVVDKVERLLEVLAALREDPVLGNAFVLHGGTALNLFYEPAPRLSIDIDLLYIEEADLAQMRARRPETDARFCRLISSLGYTVRAMNDEHSGQTYRLRYPGDFVKADISYLSRVTMLGLLSEKEKEYFCLLDENSLYRPDLLFGQWPDILGRARTDPVMAWKVHHLQRRN